MDRCQNIVVGVDFTSCSASGLRQSIRIARWNQARLYVLHVLARDVVAELETALGTDGTAAGLVDDARREWSRFAAEIPDAIHLDFQIELDHPIAAILKRVEDSASDLLVLGVTGNTPSTRGAGTVATACVRNAKTKVLLVQEGHSDPFRSIVACVDFSETSLRALAQGVRIALQDDAKLYVLHVFDAPWHRLHYRAPTRQCAPDFQKQFTDGLRGRLESFCQPLATELGFLRCEYHLLDAASHGDGITQFVKEHGIDLVVLGTKGRSNIRRLLWGRTAERVVRNAPCSVLVVKPNGTAEAPVPEMRGSADRRT